MHAHSETEGGTTGDNGRQAGPRARPVACRSKPTWVVLALAPLLAVQWSLAAPTTWHQAQAAVRGWLQADPQPLGTPLGCRIERTQTFSDADGQPAYFVVYLQPAGFVIVSADDDVEPIVGFVAGATYDPSTDNPLGALVNGDIPARVAAARLRARYRAGRAAPSAASARWQRFERAADDDAAQSAYDFPTVAGLPGVSDARVPPLVASKWGQAGQSGSYLYNYYTPNHYVCGCGATALAQLMRYHQHPTAGIGVSAFTIKVDGVNQTAYTRGGDGAGGPYSWALMMLDPDYTITLPQREAIGALCYDAAVALKSSFASGGTASTLYQAKLILLATFGYSNAIYGSNGGAQIGAGLNAMVNPNLDASRPVILSIRGSVGGHGVIADGYGYSAATLYHHLNMGWDGSQDAWYNLPNVDSSPSFTTVDACVYNIYVTGAGEIISGRVTDALANPLDGVTVTAQRQSPPGTFTATTNSHGIYAIAKISSNKTYIVSASQTGRLFDSQNVTTGTSFDFSGTAGNRWGIDFVDEAGSPPAAQDGSASTCWDAPVTTTLIASDDGLPNPPGALDYVLMSLPAHGSLSDPNGGAIAATPYTLLGGGNQVTYVPTGTYAGADTFTFKANDGGGAPTGGDSNAATISISVFIPGDVDRNGSVDVFDVIDTINAFGSTPGDPNWNPGADFDGNDAVDIFDVIDVINHFGTAA